MPSREVLTTNFHGSLEETISNAVRITDSDLLQEVIRDFLAVQDSQYEIIEPHIFPDVLVLAERAKAAGYRQILVTNRSHEGRLRASPRSIVANSDLRKYIDLVICGDDSEHRKPNPNVLGEAAKEIMSTDVLVIGDQHVDAEFARNLGARGCLVCRDGNQPPHMDTLGDWQSQVSIVQSLDEVELA